jgi:hypothetical protein
MAIDQESFNKRLYDIFKTRGYKPSPKDSKNERTNPETADVFEFQFIKDGENYGKAWATIDKTSSLNLYYDDNQAGSPPGQTKGVDYDDSWSGLLKHLKQWALSKQLNFGLHDSDRLGDDMRQRDYYKMKEKMNEGYHAVNKTTSYNDNIPNVKVVIQHDKQIGEGEQRWRNVHKIFVENTEGERFAVPTRMPGIARVYGRHVAEGGTPYDERGKHITTLVEEYTKMAGFVRATRRGEFNESVAKLIAEGINHHKALKESLQKMQSHRGYNHYFESWTPALMEDDSDATSIAEMFAQETIDPRIESVLPILNRLNSGIINEIEEVNELDQWAKGITEITEEVIEEEKRDTHCSAKCCGADVKAEDCGCSPDCEHCNCNAKLDESGLQRYTGIKKYGKEGFEALQKAGRDGASEEEKGKIKDRYLTKEEKENMGSEDDDLRDEESGKNHDPKTGKRTKPHPFDPQDDHLTEGAFNRLVVDALEMSEKEFAKKHPGLAHRYNDIVAAFSEEDLKDKLSAPVQGEIDLLEEEDFRTLIKKDASELMSIASNAKQYEEEIMKRIRDRKLRIPKEVDPVKRKRLSAEIREYEKYKNKYDVGRARSAANAKDASRIEADRRLRKDDPGMATNDKVSITTALMGLIPSLAEESVIDEKDFSDKEIKMAYGILNDPRYKGGNQTGAIKAIEGIKAGLSEHPGVKRAIYKTQNEPDNLEETIDVGSKGFYVNIDPNTGKESPMTFSQFQSTWYDEFKDDPEVRNIDTNKLSLKYEVYMDHLGEQIDETKAGGMTFAGDYKTGSAGQWKNTGKTKGRPAKVGDLVGAESKHADDEMSIHQMSDEDLADYVGCSTEYAKANRDECEEVANDKSADHAPDNMLEDILRLSGYDQYKGKSTGKGAGTEYKV